MHEDTGPGPTLLLTGATGQIGRRLLLGWCQRGHTVVLALRRPAEQWPALRQMLQQAGAPVDRVRCVPTDLARPDLGWNAEAQATLAPVTCVVHLAALWGWGLSWADAERVNVQGTLALHRWAVDRRLPGPFIAAGGFMSQVPGHLDKLGLLDGGEHMAEAGARAARRWGAYEVSKMMAYVALHPRRSPGQVLPVTWVHPATVVGDVGDPVVPEHAAITGILRSLARGLMPLVPGSAAHRVPWVTGDYVVRYILALLAAGPGGAPTGDHLLLDPRSPNLLASARTLAAALGRRAPWGHAPLGLFAGLLAWPGLARWLGTSAESLSFIVRQVPDASAAIAWGERQGVRHPDIHEALRCTAQAWAQRSTS